ncbi:MAG: tRNA (adenosine(37)-N6)-dimethylallyltransferase MiaA [Deltaproteobacteria bacterium]|nr:tRNA (adenosine(37)-N6)-dimethylallyltransferase MiaA [Deltaproteobacteria bacterium]
MSAAREPRSPIVVLAGPTASGKSSLALLLAERLGAELLSVDSQQVYRGMDIGTAKPSAEEQARVPHHGIDLVEPDTQLTAADFVALADEAIEGIAARGGRTLVVGGTGLWVRALLRGLAPAPPRDEALRAELEATLEREGSPALHRRLLSQDPETAARLHPNDHVRIIRALEVAASSGEPISRHQARHGFRDFRYRHRYLALRLPRELHRARIRRRVEEMLAAGWKAEVERLLAAGHGARLRRVLGYAQLVDHLEGRLAGGELVDRTTSRTWAYAKRQLTWLQGEPGVEWLAPEPPDAAGLEALAGRLAPELEAWFVGSAPERC